MYQTVPAIVAAQIERAEVHAWLDLYAAMPDSFREEYAAEILTLGNVVLTRCRPLPFIHFNSVLNLGVEAPATAADLDAATACYQQAGIPRFFIHHNPHCQPPALADWLTERGFRDEGTWDRIYRPPKAGDVSAPAVAGTMELVTGETAAEWAAFLDTIYGLPTAPWLLALVDRPGWRHALLRQDGQIAAVRSLYLHPDGWGWLGIEAPVPGLMAPSFAEDHAVADFLIREAQRAGAKAFVADIEAPSPTQDTPAYRNWAALGFTCPYARTHYGYG